MNFALLHELLRQELARRIEAGALTGTRLAQLTGFRQAHISNFLNGRRALSLEGLDRVLAAQKLTIDHLLPLDLNASSTSLPHAEADALACVAVVSPATAITQPLIAPAAIIESLHLAASRLEAGPSRASGRRAEWQRFLALRVDTEQAAAMTPLLARGTLVVLDRHYTSLARYRSHQPNIYAVRCGKSLQLRFAEFDDNRLILRPSSTTFPVQLLSVPPGKSPSDLIIGRVCLVFNEL